MRCIEIYERSLFRIQPNPRLIETWDVLKYNMLFLFVWKFKRLIETWDVLKFVIYMVRDLFCRRLIETWDVLKFTRRLIKPSSGLINRNMRCIEICKPRIHVVKLCMINRNMRCIEISVSARIIADQVPINRNMRCIEIWLLLLLPVPKQWLIETWDVLKCVSFWEAWTDGERLIETWDVLKWLSSLFLLQLLPD